MTTQTTKVHIGTLIHGTLRNEDLLDAFGSELTRIAPDHEYAGEAANLLEHPAIDFETEAGSELVNLLIDALNEYAPPHTYFGTLEGDGSDFGFWADVDSFEDCEKHVTETPSYLRGDSEWIDTDCNVYVQINDHGNVTVSTLVCDGENHNPRGTNLCTIGECLVAGHEIWSAV
jgi:hypothetical protein